MTKIAFITGASSGIGKELAHLYAKAGYSLLLTGLHEDEVKNVQADLKSKFKIDVKALAVDFSAQSAVEKIVSEFGKYFSDVEILINNAGFGAVDYFHTIPTEKMLAMIQVNISVLTHLTHLILPRMLEKKRGKILNVASIAAFSAGPYMSVYYATKSYVYAMTTSLMGEYQNSGVHFAVLCPGITQTQFITHSGMHRTKLLSGFMSVMSPQEVAEIAYQGLEKNKNIILPGFRNKVMIMLMKLLPRVVVSKIVAYLEKP